MRDFVASRSSNNPLELSAAAVESEFDACDVGGAVRGKECHRCRVIRWIIDDSSNKLASMLYREHVCVKVSNPLLPLLRNSKVA